MLLFFMRQGGRPAHEGFSHAGKTHPLPLNASTHSAAHVLLHGDLAGGSGALVLALPLPLRVRVDVTLGGGREVVVRGSGTEARLPLEELVPMVGTVSYDVAREKIRGAAAAGWPACVLGVLPVLARERRGIFDRGAVVEVGSPLPLGGGLGAPAALGVAALSALARAYGVALGPGEAPRLAHRVRTLFAGPEASPFETLPAVFGKEGEILPIVCRPDRRLEPVPIPEGIDVLVFEAGGERRAAEAARDAFRAALREGADLLSRRFPSLAYLTEAGVHALEEVFLPEGPRAAVAYVLRENERAAAFLHATKRFAATADEEQLRAMGRALDEAEEAARACGLPAAEATALLGEIRSLGEERGVLGARTVEGSTGIALVRAPEGRRALTDLLGGRGRLLCGTKVEPAGAGPAA